MAQTQEVRAFPAYAAVALAGLGDLPDTVLDRAVLVKMRRRAPDEPVESLRHRVVAPEATALQARLAKWVEAKSAELQEAWPVMPEGLTDRPADCWEPLLAVADIAGGEWPTRARAAALKLNNERQGADPSLGVRLLADVRTVFDARRTFDGNTSDGIFTANLLAVLTAMDEAPWGDLKGKPLDARGLARRVKPFGITPKTIGAGHGQGSAKGYWRPDFDDAWKRYLPSSKSPSEASEASDRNQNPPTDDGAPTDSERRPTDSGQAGFEFNPTAPTAPTANPESTEPNGDRPFERGPTETAHERQVHGGMPVEWRRRSDGVDVCGACHPQPSRTNS